MFHAQQFLLRLAQTEICSVLAKIVNIFSDGRHLKQKSNTVQ